MMAQVSSYPKAARSRTLCQIFERNGSTWYKNSIYHQSSIDCYLIFPVYLNGTPAVFGSEKGAFHSVKVGGFRWSTFEYNNAKSLHVQQLCTKDSSPIWGFADGSLCWLRRLSDLPKLFYPSISHCVSPFHNDNIQNWRCNTSKPARFLAGSKFSVVPGCTATFTSKPDEMFGWFMVI